MAKWTDSAKWLLGGEKGAFGFGRDVIPELVGMGRHLSQAAKTTSTTASLKERGLGLAGSILGTMKQAGMKFPGASPLAMGAGAYGAYSGYRDSRSSGKGVARSVFSGALRGGTYANIAQMASMGAGYFRATQVGAGLFKEASGAATLARAEAKEAFARKEAVGVNKLRNFLSGEPAYAGGFVGRDDAAYLRRHGRSFDPDLDYVLTGRLDRTARADSGIKPKPSTPRTPEQVEATRRAMAAIGDAL